MTVLTGTFVDVAENKTTGYVTLSVEKHRSAYSGSGFIVTTERHRVPLVDGSFTSPDLDPGPLVVEAEASGFFAKINVNLPLEGTHDLHDLLEAQTEYDPPVVGRAEDAARRSRQSAEDSAEHADRAEEQRRQVDEVVADGAAAIRQHVSEDADRAETAASDSADSAAASDTARTGAETARDAAETARTGAQAAAAQAVLEKIAEIVGDAPEALDTIYELAEAVKNNQTGIGAIESALNNRVVGAFRVVVQDTPPAAGTPSNQITFVRGN